MKTPRRSFAPGELVTLLSEVGNYLWADVDYACDEPVGAVDYDEMLLVIVTIPVEGIPMTLLYSPRLQRCGWKRAEYLEVVR